MASTSRKRSYTRANVIYILYNDSDSEGNHIEHESDLDSSTSMSLSGQDTDPTDPDSGE